MMVSKILSAILDIHVMRCTKLGENMYIGSGENAVKRFLSVVKDVHLAFKNEIKITKILSEIKAIQNILYAKFN